MTPTLRFGNADDLPALVEIILTAGAGLFEQMFDGILPGLGARDAVRFSVADADSPMSWKHSLLAEVNDQIVGGLVAYPSDLYGLPGVVETLIPKRRLAPVRDLFSSRMDDTWYINSITVFEAARGMGLGKLLVQTACDLGAGQGFKGTTLHAWSDNTAAMDLYTARGFQVIEEITVQPTKRLLFQGPLLLLYRPSPDDMSGD